MDALIALNLDILREIVGLPRETGHLEVDHRLEGQDLDPEKIHIEVVVVVEAGVTGTHHHQEVDTLEVRTGIDLGVEAIIMLPGIVVGEAEVDRDDDETN